MVLVFELVKRNVSIRQGWRERWLLIKRRKLNLSFLEKKKKKGSKLNNGK